CLHISDPSPTQTYTLSLHDALPISDGETVEVWSWYPGRRADSGMTCIENGFAQPVQAQVRTTSAEPVVSANSKTTECRPDVKERDRKSTRLNSSHDQISYAVFCLKK